LNVQNTGRRRRWIISALVMVAIVLGLGSIKLLQIRKMLSAAKARVPPPVSVTTSQVRQLEWQPTLHAVGTVVAVRDTIVASEVTGTVRSIEFQNGGIVAAGQVLVQLDSSAEQARLTSAVAQEGLARRTLRRTRLLRKQGVTSEAQLETSHAAEKRALAEVANLRAIISKKTIRAPFAGRAGIRQVDLGAVLNPATPIAAERCAQDARCIANAPSRVRPGQRRLWKSA
jgi:membrane fusion protein (multidrug efflux system)